MGLGTGRITKWLRLKAIPSKFVNDAIWISMLEVNLVAHMPFFQRWIAYSPVL